MRFAAQIAYAAPPEAVIAMLADRAFQERKLAATGSLAFGVSIDGDPGTALVISTERTLPADKVPDAFRKLLRGELRLVQVETWTKGGPDGGRAGTVDVKIPGAPLTMTGQLALVADGHGGTIETVDANLKASVPLIGGRIEKAAEPALRSAIDVEQRLGREWLAPQ